MRKKLDPRLIDILKKFDEDVESAVWDCHGVWVIYHAAVERIAAKAGVEFDMPVIVEANTAAKTVSIIVAGKMHDKREWSFGEASPANCKNSYVYAMAEKRAKDRVVLKLVGLHGLAYSEEESDDFKQEAGIGDKPKSSAQLKRDGFWPEFERELEECRTLVSLDKFRAAWREKAIKDGWTAAWKAAAKDRIEGREEAIRREMERLSEANPDELAEMPTRDALEHSLRMNPLMAG